MFDIDKMYIMFPTLKPITKEGEDKVSSLEYDEDSLQNKLIELYKSVLTSTHNMAQIMEPIDIDIFKNDINNLKESGTKGSLYHFDSINDIDLLYYFRGGKAGVGQEANAVVDISRIGKLYLKEFNIGWGHINNKGETIFDEEYSQTLSQEDIDYYVSQILSNDATATEREDFIESISKLKIGDSLTAILNAFVDIAKDPYITRGNWTTSTTNTGNLMLRAGVHPLYVSAFMAQPIITEYIDFQTSNESILTENTKDVEFMFRQKLTKQDLLDESGKDKMVILTIGKRKISKPLYLIHQDIIKSATSDIENLTLEKMMSNLKIRNVKPEDSKRVDDTLLQYIEVIKKAHYINYNDNKSTIENKNLKAFRDQIKDEKDSKFQIEVFNKFIRLQGISKKVRENIDLSKTDTEGMGGDIGSLFIKANLKQYLLDKEDNAQDGDLMGISSKLDNTVLSKYFDNVIDKTIELVIANPELFPQGQKQVQQMFNDISHNLYDTPAINKDLVKDLQTEYYSYSMAKFFDIAPLESRTLARKLPAKFDVFRKKYKGKYMIIDELQLADDKNSSLKFIELNNRKKSDDFSNKFTNSWRDLIIDHPDFAEDLIKYSYLASGFKISPTQFYTFIPHEYFVQKSINGFIRDLASDFSQQDFIDKFYLNNSDNKKYVPFIFESQITAIAKTTNSEDNIINDYNEGFISQKYGKALDYVELNGKKLIYKLQGYTSEEQGIYVRVAPLSYKTKTNRITEYGDVYTNNMYKDRQNLNFKPDNIKLLMDRIVFNKNGSEFELEIVDKTVTEQPLTAAPISGEKFFNKEDLELKKGSVVNYNDKKYLFWSENNGKARLINTDGTKFSGTPNIDKLEILGAYKTTPYNGTDYIVTDNGNIYSEASGNIVYSGKDKSSVARRNKIIDQARNTESIEANITEDITFENVQEQWTNSGYTEQDWNNMNQEERQHIIDNCL